jgi:hypothetical protein
MPGQIAREPGERNVLEGRGGSSRKVFPGGTAEEGNYGIALRKEAFRNGVGLLLDLQLATTSTSPEGESHINGAVGGGRSGVRREHATGRRRLMPDIGVYIDLFAVRFLGCGK